MESKTKLLLFLLLVPPLVELISGSAPPMVFFRPIPIISFILLYGIGNLIIREAKVRWNLQWSVIFLAIVYAIFEEGFFMQSFFNTGHEDLGVLSNFGMYFGVQWPWAINLILFHATISVLIPLFLANTIWPELKNVTLLKKKGFLLSFAGILSLTVIEFSLMKYIPMFSSYVPNKLLLTITLATMIFLIYLAYYFRNSRIISQGPLLPPFIFFVLGFLFQAINILLPNKLAENGIGAGTILILQSILILTAITFTYRQIYNKNITNNHLTSLIIGNLFFYNLITFLTEFLNIQRIEPIIGMATVSVITFISLILWRKKVLNN